MTLLEDIKIMTHLFDLLLYMCSEHGNIRRHRIRYAVNLNCL